MQNQGRIQDFPQCRQLFPENCMNMKKIGPRWEAHPKFYYVDPPLKM